jgi:AcrR family transcriptional regulator
MAEHVLPRRRGRPRGGETGARDRIVDAATREFGEQGYDGATMRAIAARAGVDAALVHHYFGSKADLFTTIVDVPMRPDVDIPTLLAGPRDEVGARLIRYILEAWDTPDIQRRGLVLLRTALGHRAATPLLAGFLSRELLSRIAKATDAPNADLRAALVASQVGGLLMARYVLVLRPVADASVDELVALLGPTVQRYLFD